MEALLGICVGIGLSAACGFRIFVPMLGISIAANAGHLELASGFEWMATSTALVAFGAATALEIAAYYVPWLDNLLDSIATPAAIVAGTVATGSMTGDISPFLKWGLAIIAGGGTAAVVQATSVVVRGVSSATSGGLANPLVSSAELAGVTGVTFLVIFVPALAACLTAILIVWLTYKFFQWLIKPKENSAIVQ